MIDLSMLDELLESILFVSGNGLKIEDIAQHLEIKTSDVNASIKRLKEKYGNKSGIHLFIRSELKHEKDEYHLAHIDIYKIGEYYAVFKRNSHIWKI